MVLEAVAKTAVDSLVEIGTEVAAEQIVVDNGAVFGLHDCSVSIVS